MSMSDQYDDGRYDSPNPGIEHGRYYPDGILAPPPGLADEHGFAHTSIGYVPITVRLGGMKYPTSTEAQRRQSKETHMPEPRMTKAQIANELRTNSELMDALRHRRAELQRQHKKAIPVEPPPGHTMFTISVRFKNRGRFYQFLILRYGGVYFTTGGKPEHSQFASWAKLCEWLEGPEVYSHSDLEILTSSGKAVSFTSGAIERMDKAGEPPF